MRTEGLLRKASQSIAMVAGSGALAAALVAVPTVAHAQAAMSDAELQTTVSGSLRNDAKLSGAKINATASQGVVTLTGDVATEDQRTEAEQAASGVSGIRSIEDNINVTGGSTGASGVPTGQLATAAAAPPTQAGATASQTAGQNPAQPATQSNGMPPPPPDDDAATQAAQANQQYTPFPNGSAPQQGQNSYPQQSQNGYPQQQPQGAYPQQQGQYPNQYPDQGGYAQQDGGWGPRGNAHVPQQAPSFGVSPQQQNASGPVTIAPGTLLSVRTVEPLSTNVLKGGEYFQVTAASDTYVNGVVAVPRGAVLTGQVVESKNAGALGGRPKLDLRLTSMQLGPTTYPVASEVWTSEGASKAGYTAANTAGGAVVGALIGAIAGGGVGAGVGAIAGGTGGALISGATHGPRLDLPPEAMLQFHLTAPLTVQPVHYDEAVRLASSVPQQPVLRQRPVYVAAPYGAPYPPAYVVRPYPYRYGYGYPY